MSAQIKGKKFRASEDRRLAVRSDSTSGPAFAGDEWISYTPGSIWILDGAEVAIERITAMDRVVVRRLATQELAEVDCCALAAAPARRLPADAPLQLETAATPEIVEAKRKEAALDPFLNGAPLTDEKRRKLATDFSVNVSTVKRWLKDYRALRHWSAFLKKTPGLRAGTPTLDPAVEAILAATIKAQAKVDQDFTAGTIFHTVETRCTAAGLKAPSIKAIRVRVKMHMSDPQHLPEDVRREHERAHTLVRGRLVIDDVLDVVQVDHTPLDLPVKCPITGRSIGCPYITIVFDVKTRVVLGFCLTLEAPSQLSTALALHHAVFPKDDWLREIGATGPWPFYGIMRLLHTDNASEFVSPHFIRAAKRWNIQTKRRKAGEPQHGGHIERFLGTLMRRIHGQKGASRFRNKRRRQPTEAHHTLASLKTWVANEITAYHYDNNHRTLGMSPARAWEQAWMTPEGLRLPCFPRDEREFHVSFLPGASRVVSREGIAWKGLQYRCPELEMFIHPAKRQFFRFDKCDISRIYFDTGEGPFLEVPWTQTNYPRLSLWEWDELRPMLSVAPRQADGLVVHQAREANRELNRRLQSRSQRARRRLAREAEWSQALPPPDPNQQAPLTATLTSVSGPLDFEVLE